MMKRIIVDAMGGDNAPEAIIEGTLAAVREYGVECALVGPEDVIASHLARRGGGRRVEVIHAPEVIGADESPVKAIRGKREASMTVGLRAVKEGRGGAFLSAGNTGALMVGGLFIVGRIKGIERPALGTVLPTVNGNGCLLLDVGANADARPQHLVEFALMGGHYAKAVGLAAEPRVGLLNIGAEAGKGNAVAKEAYELLKGDERINFVGNVEARELLSGQVEVVVCDGFVGNIVLKHTEGVASMFLSLLRETVRESVRSRMGGLLLKPALKRALARLDYAEYGGAPLLGLRGVVVKCHGSSDARAIKNGIMVAHRLLEGDLVGQIQASIEGADSGHDR